MKLQNTSNQLSCFYRRKTFILSFVATAKSMITITKELLDKN